MAKIKVRKDVAEQMTSKLKTLKNENIKAEFVEKLQKSALNCQNQQDTSNLQTNKNIFTRGDFDEYKIKNMGVTPDGQVYDLDNPTEKFYYDLKMKFAENDKTDDIEKSHKYRNKKWMNGHWVYEYDDELYGVRIKKLKGLSDENQKPLKFKDEVKNYDLYEYYINGSHDYVFVNKNNIKDKKEAWCELKIGHNDYLLRTDLRKEYKEKMQKYKNTFIKNNDLVFRFTSRSIDKLTTDKAINKSKLNGFSTKEHFEAAYKIKDLIENVKQFEKYPDRKGKKDVIAIYRGNVPISLSTRKGIAHITIQEFVSSGKLVYSVELMLKKYPLFENKGFKGQSLKKAFQLQSVSKTDHNPLPYTNISQQNNLSSKNIIKSQKLDYNGENRKGKTFDIQITDITENNKQQKLEQFNKALNAIADNRPFVIKHIPADNSEHYENLTVRLMDFDRSKIEKAVHKVALSLDADVLASSKGESFVYESQKEITEKFYKKVTDSARAVYNFVISYFDLPDIRIISKAGELKHKGKILYNPETGKPIKESEWKKFIVELEKFLNRNYSGVGEKIVLSAESLGIILDRLSKTNSLEAIRKMSLSTLKTKRYDVDWVSESIKNMKDKFGDVISRERQARIQIAMDSAAQRVTRVKDDMRNNIQQIIIDGIRDKQSKSVVAQNLFDKCASLNRDMQRIADSEVQMAANSSYCKEEVYNSKPGEKVYFKRFEMMDDNTCKACKKLNGTIALWSDVPLPDEHIKDTYAKYAIWEGKNEGSCPIGIVHPYCRGSWVRYYPDLD